MTMAKECGSNTHPRRTPDSIVNQVLSDWDARTQLIELQYIVLIYLLWNPDPVTKAMIGIKGRTQIDTGCVSQMTVVLLSCYMWNDCEGLKPF